MLNQLKYFKSSAVIIEDDVLHRAGLDAAGRAGTSFMRSDYETTQKDEPFTGTEVSGRRVAAGITNVILY